MVTKVEEWARIRNEHHSGGGCGTRPENIISRWGGRLIAGNGCARSLQPGEKYSAAGGDTVYAPGIISLQTEGVWLSIIEPLKIVHWRSLLGLRATETYPWAAQPSMG
ncbi:MAG: hypothetical protein JXA25_19580 [Anaerolineales bacterium]|nr:hypothetical protein [Anaerolineales bacterium]